jgi:hypothetical protein
MAIVLPAATTAFLTAVKGSLSTDRTNGGVSLPPSYNLLRAQDMANVLRLLQTALSTGVLTATGAGSTTTFVDGASTFVASQQVGNTFTFASDTTTASLRGVSATIRSNTTTTLTFNETLPAATQTGDTGSITAAFLNPWINAIMENKNPFTSAPAGSTYSQMRPAQAGLLRLIQQLGGTVPSQTLLTTTAKAGTSTTVISCNTLGPLQIDQLKGKTFTYATTSVRRIISHTADGVFTLDAAVTAPSGGEAVVVSESELDVTYPKVSNFYSGAHSGDNYKLSNLINAAQAAVLAATVPT